MKSVLLKIVRFVHQVIGFFIMFGCFLPHPFVLCTIFGFPLAYLQYQFNDNRCVITDLQRYLGDTEIDTGTDWPDVRTYFSRFGISKVSDKQIEIVMYTIWFTGWCIALARI